MRRIQQPGTGTPERIQWVECGGRAFSLTLPAGVELVVRGEGDAVVATALKVRGAAADTEDEGEEA